MRIKVCCIQSINEARLAISLGAHALGLVSEMPSGSGFAIASEEIARIVDSTPPTISTVLLTPEVEPEKIALHQKATGANTLQLVGAISPESVRDLRESLPGIKFLKVVHVQDSSSIDLALSFTRSAHGLLLDTSVKRGSGMSLGGTGIVHDWSISRQIVEKSPLPIFLAGGLSPRNVDEAIQRVGPFGVDVCSSLRPEGSLDPDKLRDFIARSSTGTA